MNSGVQTSPGAPGSFPLPNASQQGTVYSANKMHPSAALGPRQNPLNRGQPTALAPRGGPSK